MKKIFFILFVFCGAFQTKAQDIFITKGKIEFEKRLNMHRELESRDEDGNNSWISALKKTMPQYKVSYFDLYFTEDKTLYKPGREDNSPQKVPDWLLGPATDNVIFNDLSKQQTFSQKNVFENTFLIQDSLRKMDWRITNDTRIVAGIECRKAVGVIMDSVYVIAFYTDQIIPSGGPESFHGLPGMILGIAIPRINTTWFATKLELVSVKPDDIVAPKKGKKLNNTQLIDQLKPAMKDWGKYGQSNIWKVML